mmetsp:Transcript_52298/g.117355  ORF Transcript_52298/g.117355 Transcript_52298/m.117355 type:complete len:498 (+) Transcript_52298:21-1514(+)
MDTPDLMSLWAQNHAIFGVLLAILLFLFLLLDNCRSKPAPDVGPYRDRDFVHHQDLVDPAIRKRHLDFNAHLHSHFSGQRFVQVKAEQGCWIAFSNAACKEVMNDHVSFSSNPFADDRLVALNTMAKADHTRVLRYVHKHYSQEQIEKIKDQIQQVIQKHTDDLVAEKVDVVWWAKRIHMSSTLARLGVDLANFSSAALDEVIALNDAMVALVAPLGGVGRKYDTLSWDWWFWLLIGLLCSLLPVLHMALRLGVRCTWEIIRPDVTVLNPPRRPRMGLWWQPSLLPLVPRYFKLLHRLLYEDASEGLLKGLRQGVESGDLSLAECLTLMVQLMVNMTSANALCSLVYRLATEKDAFKQVVADPSGVADRFIQEVLRLDAPLQRNPRRCVRVGPKFSGANCPAEGDQVLLFLGAANMDPAIYKDPGDFRLDREEPPPLTFGSGMHYCLGSSLVKLELLLTLKHLCGRCQSIEVEDFERLSDVDVGNWGFEYFRVRISA